MEPQSTENFDFVEHSFILIYTSAGQPHLRPEMLASIVYRVLHVLLAPVVRRVVNVIHWINHFQAESVVCFVNTYPLDSDFSGG